MRLISIFCEYISVDYIKSDSGVILLGIKEKILCCLDKEKIRKINN